MEEEFRVGNYFSYGGSIARVEGIATDGILYLLKGNDVRKTMHAGVRYLDLREDILLDFGFEKNEEKDRIFFKSPHDPKMIVFFYEKQWHIGFSSIHPRGFGIMESFLHVHKLQNAYYEMVRNELTLKRLF